jgi:hypothetical protein
LSWTFYNYFFKLSLTHIEEEEDDDDENDEDDDDDYLQ